MTDDTPDNQPVASSSENSGQTSNNPGPVYLVSYPKIVFLYPTVLAALFGAIYMWVKGNDPGADYAQLPGRIFLLVLMINFVVIAFDFPRTTSLTWFFAVVAVSVGLWTLFHLYPDFAPWVTKQMLNVTPKANASFYMIYVLIMLFLFTCVMISCRFDYWEVRGNELLHHHGVLSDLERFSAPNLRIDKEINDVFEYMLLRSGRLILHPSQERRAIVLENVFFINQKEERITKMLGALQVRIRTEHT
ncbi:MAG: hypothetical protein GY903_08825 [Fuerstiella sp.]|nr:hypothetical protein [Fuerstiella sp.]MCP4854584.1 hypothetical protein [Fuerstiella sp.]